MQFWFDSIFVFSCIYKNHINYSRIPILVYYVVCSIRNQFISTTIYLVIVFCGIFLFDTNFCSILIWFYYLIYLIFLTGYFCFFFSFKRHICGIIEHSSNSITLSVDPTNPRGLSLGLGHMRLLLGIILIHFTHLETIYFVCPIYPIAES